MTLDGQWPKPKFCSTTQRDINVFPIQTFCLWIDVEFQICTIILTKVKPMECIKDLMTKLLWGRGHEYNQVQPHAHTFVAMWDNKPIVRFISNKSFELKFIRYTAQIVLFTSNWSHFNSKLIINSTSILYMKSSYIFILNCS